jgi:hypothetical protein
MTTLAALADRCQINLSDSGAATWPQATVEQWVNDAIRDYSNHFPRYRSDTLETVADDRTYDLPADFMNMIYVEYPTGQSPPEYLSRMNHQHPEFWNEDYWYDIIRHEDVGDVDELWISKKPSAGQTITFIYRAWHDFALANSGTITVPAVHENILMAFVYWTAQKELLAAESQSPTSNSSLIMAQLASNADRSKRAYSQIIAQAQHAQGGRESALIHWQTKAAELDRIY